MRKIQSGLLAIVMSATLLFTTSCGASPGSFTDISQASAQQVSASVEAKYSRVIAVANGSAEIISALGYRKIIIGRDIASTDKDLRKIEVVTSGHLLVAETILARQPDLLLIDASTGPANAIKFLRNSGINIVTISESWNLKEIPRKITEVASAIGVDGAGIALNSEITSAQAKIKKISKNTRIAFLYLRGGSAIYLIGGKGSGADSLISAIGATDVGAQALKNPYNPLTAEAIIALKPDLFIVMSKGLASVGGIDGLVELPGIAQTSAGENRRVISVDDSLLLSFGPRTPDLLVRLSVAVDSMIS